MYINDWPMTGVTHLYSYLFLAMRQPAATKAVARNMTATTMGRTTSSLGLVESETT